ncbi:MAG: hypothetical protein LBT41_04065 [Candidatus Methanoplasma sp.]|jgi:predicted RNA binding protein with dsRBD fold (UPF0201 family)|nr:hypothetical protein [Candidatus Methanoplasma sp.]
MVSVRISCPVNPSEDPEKVRAAVLGIFPGAELETDEKGLSGSADLEMFSRLIRRQKILDGARAMLFKGVRGKSTVIHLNKQVATVGKVSFAEPRAVLGTLEVRIEDDDIEALIDRVAPATEDGREVRA